MVKKKKKKEKERKNKSPYNVRLILGIGNPGRRYRLNRHNVGFMFLDYMAEIQSLSFLPGKGDFYFAEGELDKSKFNLIKPSTYVNNSGKAALEVLKKYNADLKDLLVIVDDLNINFPNYRVRAFGGDGGHNGMSSIIYHLNSDRFPRLRFGIGSSFEKGRMAEFVLSDFTREEMKALKKSFSIGFTLAGEFIKGGTKQMLDANSRLSSEDFIEN